MTDTQTATSPDLRVDWLTVGILSVFALIQALALEVVTTIAGTRMAPPTQVTGAPDIGGVLVVVVGESLALAGAWLLWTRLPERWRELLSTNFWRGALLALFTALLWASPPLAVLFAGCMGVVWVLSYYDLLVWLYNTAGILLGGLMAGLAGIIVEPGAAMVLLLALAAWDHYGVNVSRVMKWLVDASMGLGLPNMIVFHDSLQVDMDALKEAIRENDPRPDGVIGIIGVGDFALPAVIPASLLAHSSDVAGSQTAALGAVLGTVAAFVLLRSILTSDREAAPGLPYLSSGAVGGVAIGALVGGWPLVAQLLEVMP